MERHDLADYLQADLYRYSEANTTAIFSSPFSHRSRRSDTPIFCDML